MIAVHCIAVFAALGPGDGESGWGVPAGILVSGRTPAAPVVLGQELVAIPQLVGARAIDDLAQSPTSWIVVVLRIRAIIAVRPEPILSVVRERLIGRAAQVSVGVIPQGPGGSLDQAVVRVVAERRRCRGRAPVSGHVIAELLRARELTSGRICRAVHSSGAVVCELVDRR